MIDLGEDRSTGHPDGRPAGRRAVASPGTRWAAVVIAVVVAVGLGAATPRLAPLRPVTLDGHLGAIIDTTPDRLYVLRPAASPATGRGVVAYAMPTGRPLWAAPLPPDASVRQREARDGVLVLTVGHPGGLETLALAAGRVLWRRPYPMVRVAPAGRHVLLRSGTPDGTGGRVHAVDPVTGHEAWSYAVPDGARDYHWAARSAVLRPDGRLTLRDRATGAIIAETTLPLTTDRADPDQHGTVPAAVGVDLVGDLLLVRDPAPRVVTALDPTDLTTRWRRGLPTEWTGPATCGRLLCFATEAELRAIDPADGHTVWSSPVWSGPLAADERLLVVARRVGEPPTYAVLDPRTGEVRSGLGGWQPRGVRRTAAGTLPLTRYDVRDQRLWVGDWDPRTGRVRARGFVTGVRNDCVTRVRWLLCRRPDGAPRAWRMP